MLSEELPNLAKCVAQADIVRGAGPSRCSRWRRRNFSKTVNLFAEHILKMPKSRTRTINCETFQYWNAVMGYGENFSSFWRHSSQQKTKIIFFNRSTETLYSNLHEDNGLQKQRIETHKQLHYKPTQRQSNYETTDPPPKFLDKFVHSVCDRACLNRKNLFVQQFFTKLDVFVSTKYCY